MDRNMSVDKCININANWSNPARDLGRHVAITIHVCWSPFPVQIIANCRFGKASAYMKLTKLYLEACWTTWVPSNPPSNLIPFYHWKKMALSLQGRPKNAPCDFIPLTCSVNHSQSKVSPDFFFSPRREIPSFH